MSSVVNKSKNKFAPKAKVRPRPGTVTAATAAALQTATNTVLQSPSKSSQPPAESQVHVAPKPGIQQEQGPTIAPRAGQHDEVLADSPELPRSRVVTVPALRTARAPSKQSLRHTSAEGSRSAGTPATQPVPDQRIPRLRSATAETPSIRASSSEGGLSDGAERQTKDKGKAVMGIGPHGPGGLNVQRLTRKSIGEAQNTVGEGEELRESQTDNRAEEDVADAEPPVVGNAVQSQSRKRRSKKQPTGGSPKRPPKKRKVTTRPRRVIAGDVTAEQGIELATEPAEQTNGEEVTGSEGSEFEEQTVSIPRKPRRHKRTGTTAKPGGPKKASGRRREESPEDGEEQEISPSVTKMKELCKDIRIGRKSKRFVELQQMNWKQASSDQRATNSSPGGRRTAGEDGLRETAEERLERLSNERQSNSRVGAPQMRIANGELVLDQESIQVNSHDRDAIDEGTMEVVEENMAYRRVTSATWSRHRKVEKWDIAETQRFYNALSMFGTDFEIMSKMFPARNRKQMRSKFTSEERKHPEKITAALRTRVSINVNEYSQMADVEIGDPQVVNDELEKIRELHEAEEQAAVGHAAEMERERQENANAAMRAGDNAIAAADQSKKGKKKKGAKDRSTVSQGVEEVLSMSREEYEAERLRELAEADEI